MKVVKEQLYENNLNMFTKDGDPIKDMGIGIEKIIKNWLYNVNIKNYRLTKKNLINVYSSVNLSNHEMQKLPDYINFNHIIGGLECEHTGIISLKGFPYSISGSFLIRNNNLKTLEYGPSVVKGIYSVSYNQLESLEHIAEYIERGIYISHNKIKSLKYIPKIINGDFFIHDNPVETIEYFPEVVEGDLKFTPSDILTSEKIQKICNVKGYIIAK